MRKILFSILLMITMTVVSSCSEGHSHVWTSSVEKSPTCTDSGILVRNCPCGATERQVVDPKGHGDPVTETVREADCTNEGLQETVCPDCGKVYESTPVPALGHNPATEKVIKSPTCTEKGMSTVYCTRCNVSLGVTEMPALGHSEDFEIRRTKDPTCESTGIDSVRCTVCHTELSTNSVPAIGHLWSDDAETISESTCSVHGKGKKTCLHDSSHVTEVNLPLLPHVFTGPSYIKSSSTCSVRGEIGTKCVNCGYENISYLPLEPHSPTWIWKTDELGNPMQPTQEKEGCKIWYCSVCDAFINEEIIPKTSQS